MRYSFQKLILLSFFLTVFTWSCSLLNPFGANTETLSCNDFDDDIVLRHEEGRDIDYIIDCLVEVDNIDIEIQENVVVEFTEGSGLIIHDEAKLTIVSLVKDEPITLRGEKAIKGYWKGIYLDSDHNINRIQNAIISDAGDSNDDQFLGGVTIQTNGWINACTISNMDAYGIYIHDYAVIREGLYELVFNDCGAYPISAPIPEWDQFKILTPPAGEPYGSIIANNCVPNKVEIRGSQISELQNMSGLVCGIGIPFEVGGDVVITQTQRLDFYPDVEIEMLEHARIYIYGSFTSKGESGHPAIIYGAVDQPGYWGGIYIDNNSVGAQRIEYLHILNGGGGSFENANLTFRNGSFVVDNCKISKSSSCGIRFFSNDVYLSESGNTFADNAGGAICEN